MDFQLMQDRFHQTVEEELALLTRKAQWNVQFVILGIT